jgi:phosphopantethiene--protein transferase domain
MIKGIGIDTTSIPETARFIDATDNAFIYHTFSENEISEANASPDKAGCFASKFAVKEAAFKAIAPLSSSKTFDLRIVETLHTSDGSPYIHVCDKLREILEEASIDSLLVSITKQDDYATAIVIACNNCV